MKFKIGMAVMVEGVVSIITKRDTTSTIPDIYFIDGKGWYNDWQFNVLPNHFINNPGKRIMKARINKLHVEWGWCIYPDEAGYFYGNNIYTTKQGARKALKKWAKAYGVNIEIIGDK